MFRSMPRLGFVRPPVRYRTAWVWLLAVWLLGQFWGLAHRVEHAGFYSSYKLGRVTQLQTAGGGAEPLQAQPAMGATQAWFHAGGDCEGLDQALMGVALVSVWQGWHGSMAVPMAKLHDVPFLLHAAQMHRFWARGPPRASKTRWIG